MNKKQHQCFTCFIIKQCPLWLLYLFHERTKQLSVQKLYFYWVFKTPTNLIWKMMQKDLIWFNFSLHFKTKCSMKDKVYFWNFSTSLEKHLKGQKCFRFGCHGDVRKNLCSWSHKYKIIRLCHYTLAFHSLSFYSFVRLMNCFLKYNSETSLLILESFEKY